ncbi:hypothetical protein [Bacillus sp. V5-8f]|nr:hypothetical protein [Bacillus sp. V5-8f]
MKAITHQTFGITFGLSSLLTLEPLNIQPEGVTETTVFFSLFLFGSLLPE